MKVVKINNLNVSFNSDKKPLIAIWGFFDGWHIGHQALLQQMQDLAKKNNYKTLVISFNAKPQSILLNEVTPILLNNHDKQKFLINRHVDYYYQLEFTHELAQTSAEDFINWLIRNNVVAVVTSKDVHFGHKGKGNLETLENSQLKVFLSEDIYDESNRKISSSYIKELLMNTHVAHANKLLSNEEYTISGRVVDGIKEGRALGFPTANLELTDSYVTPGVAVYITETEVDGKWYQSMTVIHMRNNKQLVETHLLNFNQDIYNRVIKVRFLSYLRDNLLFTTKEALIDQINQDLEQTIAYFKKNEDASH